MMQLGPPFLPLLTRAWECFGLLCFHRTLASMLLLRFALQQLDQQAVSIFFDGALCQNKAGFGVVVQARDGQFLGGLLGCITEHFSNIEMVESTALLHAIRWSQIQGFRQVIFCGDCLVVIQKVLKPEEDLSEVGHIIHLIKDLLHVF